MPIFLIIFDMDGTLTEELLDFDRIRLDLGLPPKVPILEALAALPAEQRQRAHAILDEHEMAAAIACKLHDGAADLLAELRRRRIKTALLTRNSLRCATAILTRHALSLDHISTREDLPHKPHPDSILNIIDRFSLQRSGTLMVGDYLYDLDAATAAGVPSALFVHPAKPLPPFAPRATYLIRHLPQLLDLL